MSLAQIFISIITLLRTANILQIQFFKHVEMAVLKTLQELGIGRQCGTRQAKKNYTGH